MIEEDDLVFEQSREFSPQWRVRMAEEEVALVTERYVASPRFVVRMAERVFRCETSEGVVEVILRELRERNAGG